MKPVRITHLEFVVADENDGLYRVVINDPEVIHATVSRSIDRIDGFEIRTEDDSTWVDIEHLGTPPD